MGKSDFLRFLRVQMGYHWGNAILLRTTHVLYFGASLNHNGSNFDTTIARYTPYSRLKFSVFQFHA